MKLDFEKAYDKVNNAYADWKTLSPELSQHSRSQARVKKEVCVKFWQTSIKNNHSNEFENGWQTTMTLELK